MMPPFQTGFQWTVAAVCRNDCTIIATIVLDDNNRRQY